ncbi:MULTISPECIES: hypothetical protein [Lysobacter]|jgi:ABC-type antimicrobial peptide transport system ATPase subunit|uniref:hypothetical protein n=1 Tax=Lysobacter TaxID=68 RepID=UPI001F19D96F|nr:MULTISPECIES: hypothetical protein [Lysobacter]UJB18977.1 hypothetical protein L1A79_22125 [Lysobacter capsici]UJQ27298.1 hypothetical protein L2D09_17760 [Lysobacter gummosus]
MRHLSLPFAMALFAAAPLAQAASACHVEGQVAGMVINECTQSLQPISDEQLKQQCNGKVPGLEELGGQANARLVPACPSGAKGVCESPMGAQAKIHYYKRSAEELANLQRACQMQRGKWTQP